MSGWRDAFGLAERSPPELFNSADEVVAQGASAPQPHTLRLAFEKLHLDAILCQDRLPLIYFRAIPQIGFAELQDLYRGFWNQGVAPILVVITEQEILVYSSLAAPESQRQAENQAGDHSGIPGFIECLPRLQERLSRFIIEVETGDYFRRHQRSFAPDHRVDRELLRNLKITRSRIALIQPSDLPSRTIDTILCRLVFACYLFDRKVIDGDYLHSIGVPNANHLRDILGDRSWEAAREGLFRLFSQLAVDFNGDLFDNELAVERHQLNHDHIELLSAFFRATDMGSGQQKLWPYDFSIIPIETISAIYEHFLSPANASPKARHTTDDSDEEIAEDVTSDNTDDEEQRKKGAFYTPRMLAEVVLDICLEGAGTLLTKRFLDPACGSGIFLVGLFNRLAEEWSRTNPHAPYEARANALMSILQNNIVGIDTEEPACRVSAFSLYLALLDQMSPPDIRLLQQRGQFLPNLLWTGSSPNLTGPQASVADGLRPAHLSALGGGGGVYHADFFLVDRSTLGEFHYVIGNPPWVHDKDKTATARRWCERNHLPFPQLQIARAFVWKAPAHLTATGKVCFVLPYGLLFNHSKPSLGFQRAWLKRYAFEVVLNLVDYQRFLFAKSGAPTVVVRYSSRPPMNRQHKITYWAPKTDWQAKQAHVITVHPQDRYQIALGEALDLSRGVTAPLIWKERTWSTPRDWRLLSRLSLLPRLGEITGGARHKRRWLIAQGFQEPGRNDTSVALALPTKLFVSTRNPAIRLVLSAEDCDELPSNIVTVRARSNKHTAIYETPHVLVTKGMTRVAFADVNVAFGHAMRGICGPKADRRLLMFLAAFMQSDVARYFLFHTSSNWGISRAEVQGEELLRLPFPLPEQTDDPSRSRAIIDEVVSLMEALACHTRGGLLATSSVSDGFLGTRKAVERLVQSYFDVDTIEQTLVEDTIQVIEPSTRPTQVAVIETIRPPTSNEREIYKSTLCDTLNRWAWGTSGVSARIAVDGTIGLGLAIIQRGTLTQGQAPSAYGDRHEDDGEVLKFLAMVRSLGTRRLSVLECVRGVKIFHGDTLYVMKPLALRFWTRTAALNDADDIAAAILMGHKEESV